MKDFTFKVEELIYKYIKKDSLVLDVGCGTGIRTSKLKQKTKRITGLDLKNFVKEKYKSDFKLVLGDGTKIPFRDKHFDFVTCWDVIEHVEKDELLLREIHRVLKPGGLLLMSTPNRDRLSNRIIRIFKDIKYPYYLGTNMDWEGDVWHLREYREEELEKMATKIGYEVVAKEGIYLGIYGFIGLGIYKVPRILNGLTQHIFMVLSKTEK